MVFATRAFHRIEGAPFVLHCDHFLRAVSTDQQGAIAFALDGPAGARATLSLLQEGKGRTKFQATLLGPTGTIRSLKHAEDDAMLCQFRLPAQGAFTLRWEQ